MEQLPLFKRFWYKYLFLCITVCMWAGLSLCCWLGLYFIMLTYGISEYAVSHWYIPVIYSFLCAPWPARQLATWITWDMANRLKFPRDILLDWYRQAAKNLKISNSPVDMETVSYTATRIRITTPTEASAAYTVIASIVAYEHTGHISRLPASIAVHVNAHPEVYLAFKGISR